MKDRYFGTHEFHSREEPVKISSERRFGLIFCGFFALLGVLSLYHAGTRWHYWLPLAVLSGAVALIAPSTLAPLNRFWAKFGLLLHMVISPIVLGLLFYGCITPIGLLVRLTGRDLMRQKFDPVIKSYWIVRQPPGPAAETFKNQF
jgi:Saxitoxin biosynthesis operon protein SxtJ